MNYYRPQTKFAKVMFLHVSVILFTGGGGVGIPACLAGGITACLAGLQGGSPGQHPEGKLRGLARGVSRSTPRGREVSRDTPGEEGLQVHTQGEGGLQGHTWGGGSPGPHPGGSPGPHLGGSPGPNLGGCVSQHALRQAPPRMATASGGTHPTVMHSCY